MPHTLCHGCAHSRGRFRGSPPLQTRSCAHHKKCCPCCMPCKSGQPGALTQPCGAWTGSGARGQGGERRRGDGGAVPGGVGGRGGQPERRARAAGPAHQGATWCTANRTCHQGLRQKLLWPSFGAHPKAVSGTTPDGHFRGNARSGRCCAAGTQARGRKVDAQSKLAALQGDIAELSSLSPEQVAAEEAAIEGIEQVLAAQSPL